MGTRLGVVSLLLILLTSCATPNVVRLDTGTGSPLEYRPASTTSIRVSASAFEKALGHLVLEAPLTIRSPRQGWLMHASHTGDTADSRWQLLMRKSYGGFCAPGQNKGRCLSLLDDWMRLSESDRLGVALGLSLAPLKQSIARAVEETLAPQLFYTVIATGLVTWVVLAVNPEPLFTKAAAIISAVLLIYLGVETFLEVVDASRELKRATDQATTWVELEEAGQRFADRIGPEVARVFVLAVTVVVSQGMASGASWLASRLSMLPHITDATMVGASRVGIHLANAGQVHAVAVNGSIVTLSLPASAVAMAARQAGGEAATGGSSATFKSWGSFSGLKRALGKAGPGQQWHHVVEQTPGNVERFGPRSIHNTENVVRLEEGLHSRVSGFYSSIQQEITGSRTLTVRRWLSTQSFEAQRQFGLRAIEKLRQGTWGVQK
ncbi:hypothetical protein ACJ2CR_04125 [Myxococcus faecalis]|uniref:SitA5 family polymorphic toxin n=1 Tax=Myxococcus faecalis TaxID=3115646 RepID=UPI0024C68532|nr:hypothetical protein MFMH1_46950 [Myxococcus sp. MH1]